MDSRSDNQTNRPQDNNQASLYLFERSVYLLFGHMLYIR